MANILKCKMCGGDIEVNQDMTVGKCLFCGSTMTLPRIDSDKKARLFNRANEYRLNNEFDKAYDAYKTITEEDEQEAEAYWGMLLSEYGVEYVEDPKTGKRIPTCHRTQIQSVFDNTNFDLALRYSSGESKFMYQDEAEILDTLQRKIIAVSSKVEPYDVFICYKETDDESGERTKDSVLAEDIYNELERQNIKAFFSRISLEDHLGEDYEPFIYSALKSAKVMLVVATSGKFCESVWVKNEWARFLRFMQEDDNKTIIPVYQDMEVYDFPRALSKFQMQDMGKIGAMNDLVRGIKKIIGTTVSETIDAELKSLIADKQERERRKKKIRVMLPFVVIATIIVVLILGFLFVQILKKNIGVNNNIAESGISDEIKTDEIKTIEVTSGYPDSNEYDTFTVELNMDNYNEYIEIVQGGLQPWETSLDTLYYETEYICPKGADKGWIVIDTASLNYIICDCRCTSGMGLDQDTLKEYIIYHEFENIEIHLDNQKSNYSQYKIKDISGPLTFVSLNKIKKWELNNEIFSLKTEEDIGEISKHKVTRFDELYYIPILEKYIPEKKNTVEE